MNEVSRETDDLANRLLDIVRRLTEELHPRTSVSVTLDSLLDHDLGLDSLSRVELVARIERHFKVALPERVFAEVETPRDLVRAVSKAQGTHISHARATVTHLSLGEAEAAPGSAATLVEVLQWHVNRHPDRTHIHLHHDDRKGDQISYGQLWQGAVSIAATLQQQGLTAGEPVAIMLPTGKEYFFAFFAILLAGGVPVSLYPPTRPAQIEDHLRRYRHILGNCGASVLIVAGEVGIPARLLKSLVESIRRVTTVDELHGAGSRWRDPQLTTGDTAFLQYTSGSTGNPKGVILSHTNLLANIRAMGKAVEASPNDVFVSWLPLYHDMGLIGAWLGSLYFACPLVIMSPLSFLARPQRWLQAIHQYKGTLSAAPNFAFELCLRRLRDEDLTGLDLSSWRVAFNGAEPVNPDTTLRFCERFNRYGFRRETMMPVYGLAESAVGLAFPPLNEGPVIDAVKRQVFMRSGRALPVKAEDTHALRFVGCGRPLPQHAVRIVDAGGHELPEREQGYLQFRGPSATSGYYRNPDATRALFKDGWLDSGDMAYIAGGDVFITGRVKDIVIRAGRNIYPHELEEAIGDIDGIRQGRVAVFGSHDPESGTENLVTLAETYETDTERQAHLCATINQVVMDLTGAPPDDVVLAPPGTVLKTSSGKIRRAASRELYETGQTAIAAPPPWLQVAKMWLVSLVPTARRTRRRLATVAYASYAWTMFMLLAVPTWTAIVLLPHFATRWKLMGMAARTLARLTFTAFSVEGRQRVPVDRPCVIVSNHASYLDGPVLVAALQCRFSFIAKGELLEKFIPRLFLRRIGTEFVERFDKQQSVDDAERLANLVVQNHNPLYFAEGTFQREAGLLPFRMGAFLTATRAGVPVIPVTIRGTRTILRADSWFPRHGSISVIINSPVYPPAVDVNSEQQLWNSAIKLRDEVRREILGNTGEPDLG